jgi:hypothetical protein
VPICNAASEQIELVVVLGLTAVFGLVGRVFVGHDVSVIRSSFVAHPGEMAGVFPEGVEFGGELHGLIFGMVFIGRIYRIGISK